MVEPRLTAAEAATQIVGLINSRPATPWPRRNRGHHCPGRARIRCRLRAARPCRGLSRGRAGILLATQSMSLGPLRNDAPDHDPEYLRSTELSSQTDVAGNVCSGRRPPTYGAIWSALPASLRTRMGMTSMRSAMFGWTWMTTTPVPLPPKCWRWQSCGFTRGRFHSSFLSISELVRLISAWRYQRDIIDRTAVETAGILTDKELKPSEEIIGKAIGSGLRPRQANLGACQDRDVERRTGQSAYTRGPGRDRPAPREWRIKYAGRYRGVLHGPEGDRRAYRRAFLRSQRWRGVRPPSNGRPLLTACAAKGRSPPWLSAVPCPCATPKRPVEISPANPRVVQRPRSWSGRRRRCSPRFWNFRSASTSAGLLARTSAIGGRFPMGRIASATKCLAVTTRC